MSRRSPRTVRKAVRTLALPGLVLLVALALAAPAASPHEGLTWPMTTSINEIIDVPINNYTAYMTVLSTNERVVYDVRVTSGSNIDLYILSAVGFGLYAGDQSFQRLAQVESRRVITGEYGTTGQIFIVVDNVDLSGAMPTGRVTVSVNLSRTSASPAPVFSPLLWAGIGIAIVVVAVVIVLAVLLSRRKPAVPPTPPTPGTPPPYGQYPPPQPPPPSGPYPPRP